MFEYSELKTRQREIRDAFPTALSLRTHRALSWLHRAEQETEDEDARFLFLWIAFNAAYANEAYDGGDLSERAVFNQFLQRLVDGDPERLLNKIVWQQFSGSIRLLINNEYVFQPFWRFQAGLISEAEWKEQFATSKAAANRALGHMDTAKVMGITFDRLYTLRNQIVHGGATWNGGVNRAQMRDGTNLMGQLVPVVIYLMMENHHQVWGDPCYPVVD
ncbi:MAG: hypothetical protein V2I48_12685 [Xanthomonadales bacterium]|jgi:hypothetical protein|nr:hypothetical protein [Xanthomonadales bacterium]